LGKAANKQIMEDNELTDEQVAIWVLTILIFIAGILVNIFD
jgi:hypothetical protein